MTHVSPSSERRPASAVPREVLLETIRRCIVTRRALRVAQQDVMGLIARLEPVEIRRLEDYGLYYVNLLSLFADRLSPSAIDELALNSVTRRLWRRWIGNRRILSDGGEVPGPVLDGWDIPAITDVLRDRGLIIATAHIGPYRVFARELTAMGFDVFMALDLSSSRHRRRQQALLGCESVANEGRLHICDVESRASTAMRLVSALRRRQIVLFFVDGNMGIDGAVGEHNRCRVRFMSQDLRVKYGAPYLASAAGAAVLELFPVDGTDDLGSVGHGRLTLFDSGLDERERRDAASRWTEAFYRRLEAYFLERPTEWEGVRFLHRWRTPPPLPARPEPQELLRLADQVSVALKAGQVLRLNHRRVAAFHRDGEDVLCDVDSLRTYRFGAGMAPLASRLTSSSGLKYRDISDGSRGEQGVAAVLGQLAKLYCAGVVTIAPA